jgi:predicted NUDIX family NTP pyrophosphohydrolase
MPKLSAGLLLYRYEDAELQVLLVHPGGPFWHAKDLGAWSIPKGEYEAGEDPLAAAKREFEEETGSVPSGDFIPLTPIKQPSGKIISAWALRSNFDPSTLRSNTFSMEWPPHSGKLHEFPEVDRAEWFNIEDAAMKIQTGQLPFLHELVEHILPSLNSQPSTSPVV